ncbi:hypothetical protein GCM10010103_76240 [Streptomyces paradoxus]|uniref:Uncharacterized protein n=1 Tax=Streptomyces paradoxus TaxID=66375 RepID=A0A7W9TI37_9ACTN|nr:hypothetical protein [Streptomyces paradoxus]
MVAAVQVQVQSTLATVNFRQAHFPAEKTSRAGRSPYGHVRTTGGGPSLGTNDSRSSARKAVQQPRQKAPVPKGARRAEGTGAPASRLRGRR